MSDFPCQRQCGAKVRRAGMRCPACIAATTGKRAPKPAPVLRGSSVGKAPTKAPAKATAAPSKRTAKKKPAAKRKPPTKRKGAS